MPLVGDYEPSPRANEVWPDYDTYQASTDREIPVIVLDPG